MHTFELWLRSSKSSTLLVRCGIPGSLMLMGPGHPLSMFVIYVACACSHEPRV
jgi:hypothetical protein